MAIDVIALVGQVTRAQTAQVLGIDFAGWKLRKDDPGTPGSTVGGMEIRKRNHFVLVCASLADLERAGLLLAYEGYANSLTVIVDETSRPDLVSLALGRFPWECNVNLRSDKRGFVFTAVSDSFSLEIGRTVAALVAPAKGLDSSVRVAVQDAALARLVGAARKPGIGLGSVSRAADSIPPFDYFLVHAQGQSAMSGDDVSLLGDLGVPVIAVNLAEEQPVDLRWVSPVGFDAEPPKDTVDLTLQRVKHRLLLTASAVGSRSKTYDVGAGLNENVISDLRPYRTARLLKTATTGTQDLGGLLSALGCAGVPLQVDGLAGEDSWGGGEELRGQFAFLADLDLSDDLARQQWSVTTRRLAIRSHSLQPVWERIASGLAGEAPASDSVSVLIPSRRPEFVASIVRQTLHQSHTDREVIVGLHGYTKEQVFGADPWLGQESDVRFVEVDAHLNLGQVLNSLTAQAGGDFVAKMDDDDLYTAHHLEDLLAASRYSGAELVGCKAEFVYLEGSEKTIQRRPNSEIYDATVTGGTMLISRETLRQVGGWSPVGTAEDRLLHESVRKLGGTVYRAHGLNYLMRRGDGERVHTWNPDSEFFEKQTIRQWDGLGYPGWRTSGDD